MEKKSKSIQLTREKDTKNTVKFTEVQTPGEAPVVGTLYVQKWFAGEARNLTVTLQVQWTESIHCGLKAGDNSPPWSFSDINTHEW